jgi:Protein of unknown function (DUF4235)
MRFLYTPFRIIAAIIGARLGHIVFKGLWSKIDDTDPPGPTNVEASWRKVVAARALEAATLAGVAAAVDRASVRTFHHFTGIWPGERAEPPSPD